MESPSTQTGNLYLSSSPVKRKRRPAGTPDPDAEVVALSPKTLMESDRYVCEICNQGFQRDQNLQMHRRRHKVPWKLLKRVDPEVRKHVYICPEPSCLHHDPSHALGDLVGIKKHYRRKHSCVKQWVCEKCSKAYAVQSDYKAHLKTCGTRGHCCDCGRVFSRVESFIEHQDTCVAARNKRDVSSSDHQTSASLPSLAADHSTLINMSTSPSHTSLSSANTVIKDNYHHTMIIMNMPLKSSHGNRHDCATTAPPPPLVSGITRSYLGDISHPHTPINAASSYTPLPSSGSPTFLVASDVAPPAGSVSSPAAGTLLPPVITTLHPMASNAWENRQVDIPSELCHVRHEQTAELQLLPPKPQLESSQSCTTWGKDITSNNSTTNAICRSPASRTVDDNRHTNFDPLPGVAPYKLQLSIGLAQDDDHSTTCCPEYDIPLYMSKPGIHEVTNLTSETPTIPWLACRSAFPNGTAKRRSTSPCASNDKCPAFSGNQTVHLKLATVKGSSFVHKTQGGNGNETMINDLQVAGRCMSEMATDVTEALVVLKEARDILERSSTTALPLQAGRCKSAGASGDAAELMLQDAREKLKRAEAEKMEAEKAWKEAKRERELAEAELANVQRISHYNNMLILRAQQANTVLSSSSTNSAAGSSPSSIISSHAQSSQMHLHAQSSQMHFPVCNAGVFLNSSLFTCPNCHHTQILHPTTNIHAAGAGRSGAATGAPGRVPDHHTLAAGTVYLATHNIAPSKINITPLNLPSPGSSSPTCNISEIA